MFLGMQDCNFLRKPNKILPNYPNFIQINQILPKFAQILSKLA